MAGKGQDVIKLLFTINVQWMVTQLSLRREQAMVTSSDLGLANSRDEEGGQGSPLVLLVSPWMIVIPFPARALYHGGSYSYSTENGLHFSHFQELNVSSF